MKFRNSILMFSSPTPLSRVAVSNPQGSQGGGARASQLLAVFLVAGSGSVAKPSSSIPYLLLVILFSTSS